MAKYMTERKIPAIDDRMIREDQNGKKWVLQDKWLRITQNPVAPGYPKTGDEIELKGHGLIPNGKYIVEIVTEFEPGVDRDADGRDIRISLLGFGKDYNGMNILVAMAHTKARSCWQRGDGWARPFRGFFNWGK